MRGKGIKLQDQKAEIVIHIKELPLNSNQWPFVHAVHVAGFLARAGGIDVSALPARATYAFAAGNNALL